MPQQVVVTGLGCVSSLAPCFRTHWARLLKGESGIRPWPDTPLGCPQWHAPVALAPVADRIRSRMLRKVLQPSATMAVSAAREALADAGLEDARDILEEAGLYIGSVSFDLPPSQFVPAIREAVDDRGCLDARLFGTRGMLAVDPLLIVKGLPNGGLCGISIDCGVFGPNLNIANGSIGGAQALAAAVDAITRGDVQVAVAGGHDTLLHPEHLIGEAMAGRLAAPGEPGYVAGEGAAICVLESREHAIRRGARIYAEVAAVAESSGEGLEPALVQVPRNGSEPHLIFGDLLALAEDDAREMRAASVLGSAAITAATGAIGFTGGASGAFSFLHAAMTLFGGEAPPAISARARDLPGVRVLREKESQPFAGALVWRSDRGARNVVFQLSAAAGRDEP